MRRGGGPRRRWRARAAGLALGACLLARGAPATAQDSAGFALQRYQQGIAAFNTGGYAPALEAFRAALALQASPNTRMYVARCLVELGRPAEATTEYELAVREASDRARLDARYAATRDAAADELRALAPRVARVRVRLAGAPPGARVRVAGREVPGAALGLAVVVEPGSVVVEGSAPGRAPARSEVTLAPGQEREVTLAFTPVAAAAMEPRPTPASPAPVRSRADATPAWVALGIGAAGAVGFGVFAGLMEDRWQVVVASESCRVDCPTDIDREIDTGEAYQAIANVSLAVGAAGVVTAAVLFVLLRPAGAPRPARAGVTRRSVAMEWRF